MGAGELFAGGFKVLNVGIEVFYRDLQAQGVEAVQVDWSPPPRLDRELEDILSKIM
ncbi:MAG: hypothetical protein JRN39_08135 [Nitrososphaerota archaeon]|nr:hypothetical protein [Nitrososphaerota archaeon]MDG6940353.1 hypothetical protein [Nitrososphaerota archaeon]